MNKMLKEEHSGFAITLEVIATLSMMCLFLSVTFYFLKVMDVQRYMNTVLTATATQASRWGGNYTKAYQKNIGGASLDVIAQEQLNEVVGEFEPKITVTPDIITKEDNEITATITYHLPPVFESFSKSTFKYFKIDVFSRTKDLSMKIKVQSIMEWGELLRKNY